MEWTLNRQCEPSIKRWALNAFRDLSDRRTKAKVQKAQDETGRVTEDQPDKEEGWIVCRRCQTQLTRPRHRIVINGSHRHNFANPSGIIYEIGCFDKVSGYGIWGPPSREFAWFNGYYWQIMICAGCSAHLGWLFSGAGKASFFGLILERIS